MTGEIVEVTPAGHPRTLWQPLISAAPSVNLSDLLAELGLGPREREQAPLLLVTGAHPDDETLGCGRLLSRWAREVGPVRAMIATLGEACFDHVMSRPADLAARRLGEWVAGLAELGTEPSGCAGVPDGQVGSHRDQLGAALDTLLESLPDDRPVVLAAPWRRDPHPDHAAAGEVVASVARDRGVPMLEFPVWMTYWGDPDGPDAPRADLRRVQTDVRADQDHQRACRCFVSQLQPIAAGFGPVVPPAMLAHHDQQLVMVAGR